MPTERVTFAGAAGHELAARLDLPAAGRPHAVALFADCFARQQDPSAGDGIARALADAGIGVLRCGPADDDEDARGVKPAGLEDLLAAANYVGPRFEPPTLLIGHSRGAPSVLRAAARLDSVRAVATIGAPFDADLEDVLRTLEHPLLVMHSPADTEVDVDDAYRLLAAANQPKAFVAIDEADHLLVRDDDARWAGSVIATWAARWLPTAQGVAEKPAGDRVVTRTGERYRTEIQARGHTFVADEPIQVGGGDEGPTPYDLLVAALGACTGMTLRMYADRKEWPLDEVVVRLRHSKIHISDTEADAGDSKAAAKIDQIEREIDVLGTLDDEQRARLLEIANRCPVHRTLESDIRIVSKLVEA